MAAASVQKTDFRDAMAKLGAAVNIITTDGVAGRAGFTASAVCSVTDEPPTLLVCLNRNASVYDAVTRNGALCVNVLHGQHKTLSGMFGGKTPMAERFEAARWRTAVTGSPVLDDATVSFDCRIVSRAPVGTHDVLFCEVLAIDTCAHTGGLVYFDRRYHELSVIAA
ncbi:NADH-dependent FMN reductase RutF [Pararobbsia silviterrae]|uniref:FMN reductase (NADH) RutF n=1 Tax=Pararobbsia silviterrae TaxID=1792498 RepID=A0A494YBB7_9BURK|nr:pyrimidine utilization flavin reductase protein F [Pararobbsia silviterrae]RKP57925.1 pyrimidine utilization flavin reductase protein F [Pararobbsia silviterrae]